MLLSNERNYQLPPVVNQSQQSKAKADRIAPACKVVCTIVVAVFAAGRTGPAAPGNERADRLHLPQLHGTASAVFTCSVVWSVFHRIT